MAANRIPDGYHSVTPYLIVRGAAGAIDFYKNVFGASQRMRIDGPNGTIAHAEIVIDGSTIMLADEFPDMGFRGPQSIGGTPVSLMLYVPDVDDVFRTALTAGARELQPVNDKFYGDRSGTLQDPFGHVWTIATHKEDLSHEELCRRAEAAMKGGAD